MHQVLLYLVLRGQSPSPKFPLTAQTHSSKALQQGMLCAVDLVGIHLWVGCNRQFMVEWRDE